MEEAVKEAVDNILEIVGATFVIVLLSAPILGSYIVPIIERMM